MPLNSSLVSSIHCQNGLLLASAYLHCVAVEKLAHVSKSSHSRFISLHVNFGATVRVHCRHYVAIPQILEAFIFNTM